MKVGDSAAAIGDRGVFARWVVAMLEKRCLRWDGRRGDLAVVEAGGRKISMKKRKNAKFAFRERARPGSCKTASGRCI